MEMNKKVAKFSILIPTKKNHSELYDLIVAIRKNIPNNVSTEIIIIENINKIRKTCDPMTSRQIWLEKEPRHERSYEFFIPIRIVQNVHGDKVSAILDGIGSSVGENIIIMNDDFSHPPKTIPNMMKRLMNNRGSMIVGSRYAEGGSVVGRSFLRRILSNGAVKVTGYLFNLTIKDPISRFIAFPKCLIDGKQIDGGGYALSLELLVRVSGLSVIEIPYEYVENPKTRSNTFSLIPGYVRSVLQLYKAGTKSTTEKYPNYKKSILFLSKAGRFYTVGASGLLINYLISYLASTVLMSGLWYLQATFVGIVVSIMSNFILNKIWTFEDRNFSIVHTSRQLLLFVGISSFGAIIQLGLVYIMVEEGFQLRAIVSDCCERCIYK